MLQHAATLASNTLRGYRGESLVRHCTTLQHTAAHCNTLQHTATHRNTLQHTVTHCNTQDFVGSCCMGPIGSPLFRIESLCNALHCNTCCNTLCGYRGESLSRQCNILHIDTPREVGVRRRSVCPVGLPLFQIKHAPTTRCSSRQLACGEGANPRKKHLQGSRPLRGHTVLDGEHNSTTRKMHPSDTLYTG